MALVLGDQNRKKFRSIEAEKRRDNLPTLASIESLAIPLVQEVVFLADFRCPNCQQRVAEVMSKMNGETDSVEVSVLDKKVTVTCRFPTAAETLGIPASSPNSTPVAPLNKLSLLFMRLFFTSCRS
ncbi:OLC1v1032324C1 [Oldenlandia corymbosa var. corymbosa]|uniref:OLC1v1032324C1 n=1 Tax=Oldenlandia corymbosa var. corymbosa TaxID=529605 RepID=A0AAV1CMB5_OLDCO|nr:OLC1v1032324C1 [Oldenlandia corymbosa var. corymbosa]